MSELLSLFINNLNKAIRSFVTEILRRKMKKYIISLVLIISVVLVSCGTTGGGNNNNNNNTRGERAPLLKITDHGLKEFEVQILMSRFNQSESTVLVENGVALYADEERFGKLPVEDLGEGKRNEDEGEILLQALLLDEIQEIKIPDGEEAMANLKKALEESDLSPERRFLGGNSAFAAKLNTNHTTFSAFDLEGKPLIAETKVDTRVTMDLSFNGSSIVGPGAKLSATFDGEGLTQLRYAMRGLAEGEEVVIFSQDEAVKLCQERLAESLNGQELQTADLETLDVDAKLVYYAPSHDFDQATNLVPHYNCGGTVKVGGEEVSLLEQLIPATDDESVVPVAQLEASARGSGVSAKLNVQGGQAPYTIQWASSNTDLSEFSGDSNSFFDVFFEVEARAGDVVNETLVATVIDANGVQVNVSKTLNVEAKIAPRNLDLLVGGVRDYGIEIPAMEFGNVAQSFANEMSGHGVTQRFFWTGNNAWEQDFKSPNDSNWIDNTDITLYTGHGNSGRFTFSNQAHQDGAIDTNDATGDWGDKDLEWLALYSCQVLRLGLSPNVVQRWGQEFDGLHILLGFHTNAAANMGFTGKFANNMVRNPFLWWNNPMKVRVAWFDANDSHQPNGRVAVAMGPIRSGGVSNVNDYFHGKGPVGPDIPSSSIVGWWVLAFTS